MGVKYLESDGIVIRQGIYQESATQNTDLGHFIDLEDGRRFRYCKADGAITKAHMCQSAIVDSNHVDQVQTDYTLAIGDKEDISVVLSGAITKNDYAEGWLIVNDATGEGELYKIRKNSAAYAPCVISLYDAIRVATAVTSYITIVQSKYRDVVVVPHSAQPSGVPVGVPLITVTTGGYFFWAQTRGYCPMHIETAITVGIPVQTADTTTDGSGEVAATATDAIYGMALYSSAGDLDYCIVDLHLE